MMKFIFVPIAIMLSCGSTKSNQAAVNSDSIVVTMSADQDSLDRQTNTMAKIPTCLQNKIDSFKLKESHEMPQKVVEYTYRGKTVYYVVMPCCDFYNEVYDDHCNFLGAPDGGFTGLGDGKLPDFLKEAKVKKTIWEAAVK
ncbi:MAG: hypothetical protein IPL84_04635 [Chitinophagaceae bacterium]|nr:hypothetical protein [Chitinophagaceae bacterium]